MAEHHWRQTCNNLLHRQCIGNHNCCSTTGHQRTTRKQQHQASASTNPQAPRPTIHVVPRQQAPVTPRVVRVPVIVTRTVHHTPRAAPTPPASTVSASATTTAPATTNRNFNLNRRYFFNLSVSQKEIIVGILVVLISYIFRKF